MAETTGISWTDATWSPVTGCERYSPGCAHCYAEQLTATRLKEQPKYKGLAVLAPSGEPHWTREVRCHPDELTRPFGWRKPKMIFVNSMSDTFHKDVPDEFLDRLFATMALTTQHTYQVLTKRADRLEEYFRDADHDDLLMRWGEAAGCLLDGDWVWGRGKRFRPRIERFIAAGHGEMDDDDEEQVEPEQIAWPLPNVWLGVSVEDQQRADERIPHLLRTPAAVRFLSCEPLLGPLNLAPWIGEDGDLTGVRIVDETDDELVYAPGLDWLIVGGESGPKARPMNLEWARSLVRQCEAADVACFVKQLGSQPVRNDVILDHIARSEVDNPNADPADIAAMAHIAANCPVPLSDRQGADPSEWPADLRVRQFPEVAHA